MNSACTNAARGICVAAWITLVPSSVLSTGSDVPRVEFEIARAELNVWVTGAAEIVDIVVLVASGAESLRAIPAEFVGGQGLGLASASFENWPAFFVAHAIILHSPADGPEDIVQRTARAFFACTRPGVCTEISYTNYMVAVGNARLALNTDGEQIVEFHLKPVENEQ